MSLVAKVDMSPVAAGDMATGEDVSFDNRRQDRRQVSSRKTRHFPSSSKGLEAVETMKSSEMDLRGAAMSCHGLRQS